MATKRELRERWNVEPGRTIRERILDFERPLRAGHGRSSEEIFKLLEGLPYRDEVPYGRDLRGADFLGSREMDFSDTDFSYSTRVGSFYDCNLERARFDESGEAISLGNVLNGASFRKAKLRSCFMRESQARNCCFDDANVYHMDFKGTDLSGSSFRNANCKGVSFSRSILLNCDFRGANLEEAVFAETVIDKTTDFRGASLINACHDDDYDNAGNFLSHGVDLRLANYDATTKFGTDPLAFPLEYHRRAVEIATRDYGAEGMKMAAFFQRSIDHMLARGERSIDWENEQIANLNPQDRALYEEIMDETFRSLR
ncbi:MAG: pentapeptide repeat-containing protein [Pirellulales bacterium]|nr:pentapeptide repeat-containing protein [Pirellulales bacterium]